MCISIFVTAYSFDMTNILRDHLALLVVEEIEFGKAGNFLISLDFSQLWLLCQNQTTKDQLDATGCSIKDQLDAIGCSIGNQLDATVLSIKDQLGATGCSMRKKI